VIDRIEERHRVMTLVEQVVARVIEIQKQEAELRAAAEAEAAQVKKSEDVDG
jgi:hypothetical protein